MSKPFFYRINAAELLGYVLSIPRSKRADAFLAFASDLVIQNKVSADYTKSVIEEAEKYIQQKRVAGSLGGKHRLSTAQAPLKHRSSITQASSSNSNIKQTNKEKTYTTDFTTFWEAYPKKTGKDDAWKSWQKACPSIDDVLKAIHWQKKSIQWQKENGQYIPNPSTYINQGRWKDENVTTPSNGGQPFC